MKNWFDREPHASDDLLSWQDHRGIINDRRFEGLVEQVRSDYDLIAGLGPQYKEALERLLDRQRIVCDYEAYEREAGESL